MEKVTLSNVSKSKVQGRKISMLTAYDYSLAKIIDQAGIDIILVGDSLGNVILGYNNTRLVTMADMIHHTKAVARGVKRAFVVADLPFKSTPTPEKAVENASALVKSGAQAVKIEGLEASRGIKAIIKAGIPVMGHLGVLPQTAEEYKIQRSKDIIRQAKQLEELGVFAIVLEMVEENLAQEISQTIEIPTIGIGSGSYCDGQVLVSYDLIGLSDWSPGFVKPELNLKEQIREAVGSYIAQIKKADRRL